MPELVAKVSTMLRERTAAPKSRREAAATTSAEALVTDGGCPEALLAAMDEMGLDADDLAADARAVETARRIESQLADAERLLQESVEVLAAVERKKHAAQEPSHSSFDLNTAHVNVAEAENLTLDRQQHVRELRQQLQAATLDAHRIFSGQMRRLAPK